jgi:uncharacterized spore protein YtfJ
MQESSAYGESIVTDLADRIRGSAKVEVVFGEPREIGDKTLIPVAAVAYGFGAGAGSGAGEHPAGNGARSGTGTGSGGAGGVRVQPVGVLEVTQDETRLIPIMDWTRIITTGLTLFGVWMIIRAIFRRR